MSGVVTSEHSKKCAPKIEGLPPETLRRASTESVDAERLGGDARLKRRYDDPIAHY